MDREQLQKEIDGLASRLAGHQHSLKHVNEPGQRMEVENQIAHVKQELAEARKRMRTMSSGKGPGGK
jgi:hypothetical protein